MLKRNRGKNSNFNKINEKNHNEVVGEQRETRFQAKRR